MKTYPATRFTYTLPEEPFTAEVKKGDADVLRLVWNDGQAIFQIYYDHSSDRPLTQMGTANPGDKIEVIVMPHRIEFYVNGELRDEEWPFGNSLFSTDMEIPAPIPVTAESIIHEIPTPPDVVNTFVHKGEGWNPGGGIFVGDCMPYSDGDTYHLVFLKDRRHHGSKWTRGAHQWYHISTKDFENWQTHPMAVEITDPSEGSICTGSHIEKDGVHYMYYSTRQCDWGPQPLGRSISHDGYHYEKDESFRFMLSDKYQQKTVRDPKVFMDEDGLYHMIVTTTLLSEGKGCLAHLTSTDLLEWHEEDEPFWICEDAGEPECPDMIKYNDMYYLVFSPPGKTQYRYSKSAKGGWICPEQPFIRLGNVPRGDVYGDKIVFCGADGHGHWGGTLLTGTAYAKENGELVFEW